MSPVSQATVHYTWEARTVGWVITEGPYPTNLCARQTARDYYSSMRQGADRVPLYSLQHVNLVGLL